MKPSSDLLALAKKYLAMVDEPDGHCGTDERNQERTDTHNELISWLVAEGLIEFPASRAKARWIARYLVNPDQPFVMRRPRTYVMFVKDDYVVSPVHHPGFDEKAEKLVMQFFCPVRVTIEPLLDYEPEA